jgi:hypothetical protein
MSRSAALRVPGGLMAVRFARTGPKSFGARDGGLPLRLAVNGEGALSGGFRYDWP